jgi:hypothetical protein
MGFVLGNLQKLFEILDEDENVDAIAMEVSGTFIARRLRDNPSMIDGLLDILSEQRERSIKPFLVITHPSHVEDVMADVRRKLLGRGVAAFTSFHAAAGALARTTSYWARRDGK